MGKLHQEALVADKRVEGSKLLEMCSRNGSDRACSCEVKAGVGPKTQS